MEIRRIGSYWDSRTRSHNERTNLISSREIVGVHIFGRGMTLIKVNVEGAQGLNRGFFTPTSPFSEKNTN
jgi:hypothetical protein